MNKKTILIAFIYVLLFSAAVCFVFYGGHIKYLTHVYLIGLLCMLPFLFAAVYLERQEAGGIISGREAGKAGLRFVVAATIFMILFQAIFFETGFKEYKINYMQTMGPQILKEQIAAGKIKLQESEIPKLIATDVEGVTLFKEITSVIFKTVFFGLLCSLVAAFSLKKKQ